MLGKAGAAVGRGEMLVGQTPAAIPGMVGRV